MKKFKWIASLLVVAAPLYSAEILKHEPITAECYFDLVQFNQHTYIIYYNQANNKELFIHDPDCGCRGALYPTFDDTCGVTIRDYGEVARNEREEETKKGA